MGALPSDSTRTLVAVGRGASWYDAPNGFESRSQLPASEVLAALRSSKPPDPDRTRTLAPRRVDLAISAVCKTARARFDSAARLHAPADGSEDRLLSGPAKARTLPGAPRRVRLQVRSSVSQADQMGSIPIRGALSLPKDRRPRYERGWRWFDSTQRHCRALASGFGGDAPNVERRSSTLRESASEHGAMVAHYFHTVGIGRFEYGARFHSRRRRATGALS